MKSRCLFVSCVVLCLFLSGAVWAENVLLFNSEINVPKGQIDVSLDFGRQEDFSAKARKLSDDSYQLRLDIKHLQLQHFDLSGEIESRFEFYSGEGIPSYWEGKIESHYLLIDYKPLKDLSGHFRIKDKTLSISSFTFGNVSCLGEVDFTAPYNIDLTIQLSGVGLDEFLNFWAPNKKYNSSGEVFGEIKVSGTFNRLFLNGKLDSINGFIKKLEFDNIHLNIEGFYPYMQIAQSTLTESDGMSFAFSGPFDLSDKENFKKQIKALTLAPLIVNSDSKVEWTIKRLEQEESLSTEFKYLLRKRLPADSSEGASGVLGVERKVKF